MKMIRFPLAPGDGTIADHHGITSIDLRGVTAAVTITSYPDDGEGAPRITVPVATSMQEMPVAALALDPDPYEAVALWLTAPGRPFAAGNVSENLDSARAAAVAAIEAKRDMVIAGGIDTPFGRVQSDPVSLSLIEGAVASAMLAHITGQPFEIQWRLDDNSYSPTIDAAGVFQIKAAVDTHIALAMSRSWVLKALVPGATLLELSALAIEEGWPGA